MAMPSDEVTVRRAVVEDTVELTRLRTIMFQDMGRDPSLLGTEWQQRNIDHFRRRLAERDVFATFVIGQNDDQEPGCPLAACAAGWLNPHLIGTRNQVGMTGYVANMSTDPRFRRRGYGRRTLIALLDWMRSTGIGTVDLHATADGEHLYRALGFTEPTDPALTLRLDETLP